MKLRSQEPAQDGFKTQESQEAKANINLAEKRSCHVHLRIGELPSFSPSVNPLYVSGGLQCDTSTKLVKESSNSPGN